MAMNNPTNNVVELILGKLSYRAFQTLVQITEIFVHSKKPKAQVSTATQVRVRFIVRMLNLALNEQYDEDIILWSHNALIADMKIRSEINGRIDLADTLEKYKKLYPDDKEAMQINVLRLLPFRTVCTCGKQLSVEFSITAHVLYPDSVQPCSLYESNCTTCCHTYRVSSTYLSAEKLCIVTPESLKASFFHLSCDKFVFSRELLVSFSSLLVNGHITFHGHAAGLISTIIRLHPLATTSSHLINLEHRISRALQSHWIYFELAHFIFLTSNETKFCFPSTASSGRLLDRNGNPTPRATFLEQRVEWIYHLFTHFWSKHGLVPECSCKQDQCSRVVVIDGHQKARRIVCAYDCVTSLINQAELGPCRRGCPYMPAKRKAHQHDVEAAFFCRHHHRTNHSLSIDRHDEYAVEALDHEEATEKEENQREKNNQSTEAQNINQDVASSNTDECHIERGEKSDDNIPKRRSMGFLASFLSCGVVVGFTESIVNEGPRTVTDHLLSMKKYGALLPPALLYDAACRLRLFWNHQFGGEHLRETQFSRELVNMRLAVDRFHRKGHIHPMCKTVTNADCSCNGNKDVFDSVNSSVAEQSFSYLSKFKFTLRALAYPNSTIYMILLMHLWNVKRTKIRPDDFSLATKYLSDSIMPMFLTKCVYETVQTDATINTNETSKEADEETSDEEDFDDVQLHGESDEDYT